MPTPAHDLSWDEAERWIVELGFKTEDGSADWRRFLDGENIDTHKDTLKNRWTKGVEGKAGGAALPTRRKIRAALERLERARKTPTAFGSAMLELEEWRELGRKIAQNPALFHAETARLRQLVEAVATVDRIAEAQATIDAAMAPLTAITPVAAPAESPKRSRSTSPSVPSRVSKST